VTDAVEISRAIGKPGPRTRDDGSGVDGTGDETQVPLVAPLPLTSPGYHSQGIGQPDSLTRTYQSWFCYRRLEDRPTEAAARMQAAHVLLKADRAPGQVALVMEY